VIESEAELARRSPAGIEADGEIASSRNPDLATASSACIAGLEVGGGVPSRSNGRNASARPAQQASGADDEQRAGDAAFLIASITRPTSFSFHFTDTTATSWPFSAFTRPSVSVVRRPDRHAGARAELPRIPRQGRTGGAAERLVEDPAAMFPVAPRRNNVGHDLVPS